MQLFTAPPRQSFQPVVIPQDMPVYRIKEGKFYADDELFEAGSIITWDEEPNLDMEPMNQLAMDRYGEFLNKIDTLGREKAKQDGKSYISYADAFTNFASLQQNSGKKVGVLNAPQEVPIMGGKRPKNIRAKKVEIQEQTDVNVKQVGKFTLNKESN